MQLHVRQTLHVQGKLSLGILLSDARADPTGRLIPSLRPASDLHCNCPCALLLDEPPFHSAKAAHTLKPASCAGMILFGCTASTVPHELQPHASGGLNN